jgi:hypothetical protein
MQCFREKHYLSHFQNFGQLSWYHDEAQAGHSGFCFQQGQHIFSLFLSVQTTSGNTPFPYTIYKYNG